MEARFCAEFADQDFALFKDIQEIEAEDDDKVFMFPDKNHHGSIMVMALPLEEGGEFLGCFGRPDGEDKAYFALWMPWENIRPQLEALYLPDQEEGK